MGSMDATEMNDPFAHITDHCHISSSQEEFLRHSPFLGQTVNSPDGDGARSTLPETARDAGKDKGSQDVFLTPPEQQSSASDFRHLAVHKAVQTDNETQGVVDFSEHAEATEYVNLSDDSQLRSPLAKSLQMTDLTLVAECSRGNDGASVIEISNCEIDKFRISRRELSSQDTLGESPRKRMKNSEQNPGFKSSRACFGIEPQKIGENLQNCGWKLGSKPKSPCNLGVVPQPQPQQNIRIGKEMYLGASDMQNHFAGIPLEKNLGSHVTQSENARSAEECVVNIESREGNCKAEKLACTGTVNEIANCETSEKKGGDEQPKLRVLPPSIAGCLKDTAKGKTGNGKVSSFVFDVLKSLKKEDSGKDSLEDVSWLQLAKARGITFPRPCWWMEDMNI